MILTPSRFPGSRIRLALPAGGDGGGGGGGGGVRVLLVPSPIPTGSNGAPAFAVDSTFPRPGCGVSGSSSSSTFWKGGSRAAAFRSFCSNDKDGDRDFLEVKKDFSVLSSDIPWDRGSIWSTMAAYFFSLHVPLSFGGISAISQILHQPVLDPQTEAISALLLQTMEITGAWVLLHYSAKPKYSLSSFFHRQNLSEERNWIKASIAGLGFLILLVLLTSLLADKLVGPKDVNNPILKEILLSSPVSKMVCSFLYCFITPMLEEMVYRGFLLTSLASTMNWQQAVIISSSVFSLAHFSLENSLQLFLIGCVLGSVYCWTGNLASSFAVHSVYNSAILLVTILS